MCVCVYLMDGEDAFVCKCIFLVRFWRLIFLIFYFLKTKTSRTKQQQKNWQSHKSSLRFIVWFHRFEFFNEINKFLDFFLCAKNKTPKYSPSLFFCVIDDFLFNSLCIYINCFFFGQSKDNKKKMSHHKQTKYSIYFKSIVSL